MVVSSASSCLPCWVVSTWRCVMIATTSLTSKSKVRNKFDYKLEEWSELTLTLTLQELMRLCWCKQRRRRCSHGSETLWSPISTPKPSTERSGTWKLQSLLFESSTLLFLLFLFLAGDYSACHQYSSEHFPCIVFIIHLAVSFLILIRFKRN